MKTFIKAFAFIAIFAFLQSCADTEDVPTPDTGKTVTTIDNSSAGSPANDVFTEEE